MFLDRLDSVLSSCKRSGNFLSVEFQKHRSKRYRSSTDSVRCDLVSQRYLIARMWGGCGKGRRIESVEERTREFRRFILASPHSKLIKVDESSEPVTLSLEAAWTLHYFGGRLHSKPVSNLYLYIYIELSGCDIKYKNLLDINETTYKLGFHRRTFSHGSR